MQATPQGHNGPYLDGPLTANHDNPFGNLHLYNTPKVLNWIPGFDVDGDGTLDVDTAASSDMYLGTLKEPPPGSPKTLTIGC